MRLGYVILYVEDVCATVDFYKKAFDLKCRFIHENNTYAEMETGETALAFANEAMIKASHPFRENRAQEKPAGIEIALVSTDVEKQFKQAVDAGATPLKDPEQKPWGQTVSYVKDNNGCLVEICSPLQG